MILNMLQPRSLSQLLPSQTATIGAIDAEDQICERMAALGLRRGRLISVIRRARMNGPIQIRIGTTDLMIRRSEAAKVHLLQAATAS
jgi:ferrous iron transport protein A